MVNKMFDSRTQKPKCNADDIVSFVYEEMDEFQLAIFEKHMTNCSVCSDEVASFSNISLSVQDWRDTEFLNLETPQIKIPYEKQIAPLNEIATVTESKNWLEKLREVFTLTSLPLKTAAAFGVIAISIGLMWFLIGSNFNNGDEIANKNQDLNNIEQKNTSKESKLIASDNTKTEEDIEAKPLIPKPETNNSIPDLAVNTSSGKKSITVKQNSSLKGKQSLNNHQNATVDKSSGQIIKAKIKKLPIKKEPNITEIREVPRLTEFAIEDTDEEDIRLSDLFAEVESD